MKAVDSNYDIYDFLSQKKTMLVKYFVSEGFQNFANGHDFDYSRK